MLESVRRTWRRNYIGFAESAAELYGTDMAMYCSSLLKRRMSASLTSNEECHTCRTWRCKRGYEEDVGFAVNGGKVGKMWYFEIIRLISMGQLQSQWVTTYSLCLDRYRIDGGVLSVQAEQGWENRDFCVPLVSAVPPQPKRRKLINIAVTSSNVKLIRVGPPTTIVIHGTRILILFSVESFLYTV